MAHALPIDPDDHVIGFADVGLVNDPHRYDYGRKEHRSGDPGAVEHIAPQCVVGPDAGPPSRTIALNTHHLQAADFFMVQPAAIFTHLDPNGILSSPLVHEILQAVYVWGKRYSRFVGHG